MQSKNNKKQLVKLFEIARYCCAGFGFFLAYQSGINNTQALSYILLWVVVPLAGLTGLESIVLATETAESKGRETGSAYQTQSGLNNLAIAISAMIVWYWQWGVQASLAILFVLLSFFILSSINHTYEFAVATHKKSIHLMRPLLTLLLVSASIPLIIRALLG